MFNPLRFMWNSHKALLGGLLIASTFALAVVLVFAPLGPGQDVVGHIHSVGLAESRLGSYPVANVRVDGHLATVPLPKDLRCQVGSEIALVRQRNLLGPVYRAIDRPGECRSLNP